MYDSGQLCVEVLGGMRTEDNNAPVSSSDQYLSFLFYCAAFVFVKKKWDLECFGHDRVSLWPDLVSRPSVCQLILRISLNAHNQLRSDGCKKCGNVIFSNGRVITVNHVSKC